MHDLMLSRAMVMVAFRTVTKHDLLAALLEGYILASGGYAN